MYTPPSMFTGNPFQDPTSPQPPMGLQPVIKQQQPLVPDELKLPRFINFIADHSGCGHWRMIWPEHLLNAHKKASSQSSNIMITDPKYYIDVPTVRVQRQATPVQKEFVQFLLDQQTFKVIYEIDDICFHEDIPMYNNFRKAFTSDVTRNTCQEIMEMVDEMTVTNEFMREYYMNKTTQKNITVIPNYMPKWWIGNYYNEKVISQRYDKHRKKPRILYAGSGAHFDAHNLADQKDDFEHVLDVIAKTRKKYQWVFLGGAPLKFRTLISNGDIEFHKWEPLYKFPEKIYDLQINAIVAPLQDNTFNKAKSDIKYIEACALGLPIACQDMITYEKAPHKFTTGDEMIDVLNMFFKNKSEYMKISRKARAYAETRWLENEENVDKFVELYKYGYGSEKRININKINHYG